MSMLIQGQPFSYAHFNISKWPFVAAQEQVDSFQGQPFSRAHFNISKWPFFAASRTSIFIPRATTKLFKINRNVHKNSFEQIQNKT